MEIDIEGMESFDVEIDFDMKTLAEAIQTDITDNLLEARSYDGSRITPLKKSYADRKKKVLGHARIFDGFRQENKLMDSIMLRKINDYEYEVYVGNNNSDIMGYLQAGKSPLAGPRRAFGISQQGLKRVARSLNEAIKIKSKSGQRA